ncbi:MAG: nucleotidyltransferase family protein [Bacteroidales bacterium]|nr:nucleotidyltransferase family protein [Bacteroidales bacterium]
MQCLIREQVFLTNILRGDSSCSPGGLNTSKLLELLSRHRLFPLAGTIISAFEDRVRTELETHIKKQAFKSMLITRELFRLQDSARGFAYKLMVLKGPVLAHQLYGDVSKRQYNDLDLYLHPNDFSKVKQEILSWGYKKIYPSIRDEKRLNYYFRHKGDLGVVHPKTGVYIEIHHGINLRRLIPKQYESDFYNNLTQVKIHEWQITTLTPEYTFIYLCLHGAKHLFFRLIWLKDIADYFSAIEMDHDKILNLVRKYGLERLFGVSFALVNEYFGIEIPSTYNQAVRSRKVHQLKNMCQRRIRGPEKELLYMRLLKHYYFFNLKQGWSYKAYVLKSIFHRWYIRKFLGGH